MVAHTCVRWENRLRTWSEPVRADERPIVEMAERTAFVDALMDQGAKPIVSTFRADWDKNATAITMMVACYSEK